MKWGSFKQKIAEIWSESDGDELIRQWENDTQWANATLEPLYDPILDRDTPFELQWEEERKHGDLNYYRRNGQMSEKYKAWKQSQEDERRAEKDRNGKVVCCADDMDMSEENETHNDPNWYENSDGQIMLRNLSGVRYYPYCPEDPDFNTPGRLVERADYHQFWIMGDMAAGGRQCEELVKALIQLFLDQFQLAYDLEVEKYGEGAFELEELMDTPDWQPPDLDDEEAWSKFAPHVYTRDHGISEKLLARPSREALQIQNKVGHAVCVPDGPRLGDILEHSTRVRMLAGAHSITESGCLRIGRLGQGVSSQEQDACEDTNVCGQAGVCADSQLRENTGSYGGVEVMHDQNSCEDVEVYGEAGVCASGQWRLEKGCRGVLAGIRCDFTPEEDVGDDVDIPTCFVEPCIRIEGGPWCLQCCEVSLPVHQHFD